jgi:hypothetical protein
LITRKLGQTIELIEAQSAESLFGCAPPDYADQQGMTVKRMGSAVLYLVKRRASLGLNSVVGLGVRSPATPQLIDRIVEWYADHGVHRFAVCLSPVARPGQVTDWLRRRGFRKKAGRAKLFREAQPPQQANTRLRLEEIGRERAADWYRVLLSVFPKHKAHMPWAEARIGLPGWRHYVAYSGRTPTAIAAMFAQDGAAHLQEAVTVGMFRRRGAQSALISRRIADGLEQGCRLFTSETEAPLPHRSLISYRNLLRAGFEMAYVRPLYVYERPRVRKR